jgi:hypothetical protein
MKVKDVIENMRDYDLEDEVVVLWLTKDNLLEDENSFPDDIWSKVVKEVENDFLYIPCQVLINEVYGVLNKTEVGA